MNHPLKMSIIMVGQMCVQGTPLEKLSGAAVKAAAKVNKLILKDFNNKISVHPLWI